MKKSLLGPAFLLQFKEFDPSTINAAMVKKLKPYVENEELTPDKIAPILSALNVKSKACVLWDAWVRAVYEYGSQKY